MPKNNKFTKELGFEVVLGTLVAVIPRKQPVKRPECEGKSSNLDWVSEFRMK